MKMWVFFLVIVSLTTLPCPLLVVGDVFKCDEVCGSWVVPG